MAALHKSREAEQEVPLSGDLAQFRTALREEIDAARKAASSSAIPLVNGRRIGQGAFGHQYLFTVESALNLPDGTPGDLMIPDHPPLEATVISIDGMAITLSLSLDAGDFIPRARLQSSLVHVLERGRHARAHSTRATAATARLSIWTARLIAGALPRRALYLVAEWVSLHTARA